MALASFWIWFPGLLNNDSAGQYQAALTGQFDDWQPPIMAKLWAVTSSAGGPWPLFALNTLLYWFGSAMIAHALQRIGRAGASWLMLLGAASPLFLFFNREIISDVGLTSALVAAFGAAFWYRVQGIRPPLMAYCLAAALFAYGLLIRANAAFALPPLILYAAGFRPRIDRLKTISLCLALSLAVLPITFSVNRHVIGATDSGGVQRLQIYDLAGIAVRTGDFGSIIDAAGRSFPARGCYSPILWDTLTTDQCDRLWYHLPPPGSAARSQISAIWLKAVLQHPIAYALHRLEHFNAETFFMVPPAAQCISAPQLHDCIPAASAQNRSFASLDLVTADYLLKNPLVWPCAWLTLALSTALYFRNDEGEVAIAARALLASGLIYGLAYGLVGVAMNARYFYWTFAATQTAAVLLVSGRIARHERISPFLIAPLLIVIAVGYAFRLGDITLFVR